MQGTFASEFGCSVFSSAESMAPTLEVRGAGVVLTWRCRDSIVVRPMRFDDVVRSSRNAANIRVHHHVTALLLNSRTIDTPATNHAPCDRSRPTGPPTPPRGTSATTPATTSSRYVRAGSHDALLVAGASA